jgi:hypothetical protein
MPYAPKVEATGNNNNQFLDEFRDGNLVPPAALSGSESLKVESWNNSSLLPKSYSVEPTVT